jgi:intracellular multiplication protein IcmK
MTKVKTLTSDYKKIITKLSAALMLTAPVGPLHADVYDVLRGTSASQNLTLNNVQPAGTPAAAQDTSQDVQPTPQAEPKPLTMREEAFKELLNKTFPLKPEQIKQLHKELDKSQVAINTPATAPPQPRASTLTVDLSPGATPPVIRLATGFVTSMVFLDSTGQPWPVLDYDLGNPNGFNIKWDSKTNTLFIQSTKEHVSGNMAVRLVTMATPVMISLVTGQKDVDYRIDIQVPGRGPNAETPVMDNPLPTAGAGQALLSALDGVPPAGSVELNVAKEYGRAWIYEGKLLFRTKLTLLSPAWSATISGPDGTRVYELMQTPLLLASKNGKTIKIELTGL